MNVTEIKTKDNKIISLRDVQWKHIKYRHPEMANRLNDIEEAVRNPTASEWGRLYHNRLLNEKNSVI